MILTCPSCGTKFRAPDDALGENGRKLRCAACKHVWFARPEVTAPAPLSPAAATPTPAEPPLDDAIAARAAPCPPTAPAEPRAQGAVEGAPAETDSRGRTEPTLVAARPGAFRPVPEKRKRKRRGHWFFLLLLILIAAAVYGLYRYRTEVMRAFPETIAYYEKARLVGAPTSEHLEYRDPAFSVEEEDGRSVLVVSGRIVNMGGQFQRLPLLRAEILDVNGNSVVTWTFATAVDVLGPGDETLYRATYDDPPRAEDLTDILMTFADMP